MTEELFKLVIAGYFHVDMTGYKTKKGEYYIEKDFAALCHISRHQARELIQSSPRVIKQNLTIEEATRLRDKIEQAGVSCDIVDMHSESDISGMSLVPD